MSSHKRLSKPLRLRRNRSLRIILDTLEDRVVPSSPSIHLNFVVHHSPMPVLTSTPADPFTGAMPLIGGSPSPVGYTPDQIRTAYGINNIVFGNITGDGTGQTIAIVDAYDAPNFVDSNSPAFASSDLAQFDATFNLPDPPSFMKYNQNGQTTNLPGTDPSGAGNANGTWEMEESLDIEWAHAIAPRASIDLVEATSDSDPNNVDLFTAVATAAGLPGVSAVSMSWGLNEYAGETAIDNTFTTPTGHQGVTFFAASGDSGSPGYYPAYSPNVVAVGGTTLNLNPDNTYDSEIAWSGSGGGTSAFESAPSYQLPVQSTGMRTMPDVAFDADPNTGVAIYDTYDDTDGTGGWFQIGGTSLAAPAWAGLTAIADQGRVTQGGGTLDGPSQALPYLYSISSLYPTDFHDITVGGNGGFKAGPGYDEVTGLGSPVTNSLLPDLSAFGTATQLVLTAQPPSSVIVGDGFGVVATAEDALGHIDPAFNDTVSLALGNNPGGANLSGTLTVNAVHGEAVFDGLALNQIGNGYTLTISNSSFPTIITNPFNITTNSTPWSGTFYPVPTDASLRAAINQADSNGFASNTIILESANYVVTNANAGQLLVQNTSNFANKSLTIVGQGPTNTVIRPGIYPWNDRIFEIVGTLTAATTVTFESLSIEGGSARDGGILGGPTALGGGLLIDDANVSLSRVNVANNVALGAQGAFGATGAFGQNGGDGGRGGNAQGGGVYLANGTLALGNDTFSNNVALGGAGGAGGGGGTGLSPGHPAQGVAGGAGGNGATGGTGSGGAIYQAGGQIVASNDTFNANQAVGGPGGKGGAGGGGGIDQPGGAGGLGGNAGPSAGGAIYLAQGVLTLSSSVLGNNAAIGGAGGRGGAGGGGGSAFASGFGTGFGSTGFTGGTFTLPHTGTLPNGAGADGGSGGSGGAGAPGRGGGVYVAGGSLTLNATTLQSNTAVGGQGGSGGRGGQGAIGGLGGITGIGTGTGLGGLQGGVGGSGGAGGNGDSGYGGGLYVAGGVVTLLDGTIAANSAVGGAGGAGGTGGGGALAGGLSGGITGGTGGHSNPGRHAISRSGTNPFTGTGAGVKTGGNGGNGGNGGSGFGGGLYVTGGSVTLVNDTVATNSAQAGASGSGGPGGMGGSAGLGNGSAGTGGIAGSAAAGGLYVSGGTVNLANSTVALNSLVGTGQGDGVVQTAGTVNAQSSLFAGNGTVDYSGNVTADNSLFQSAPINGTVTGTNNLIGDDPLLSTSGLQSNGGPTQTIALQSGSPAFNVGSNPEHLFTDQRGSVARTGPSGTDIGAYQHDATADATPPTATLQAPTVTASNSTTLNPYVFTITFSDNAAIAAITVPGAVVQIAAPGGGAPISAIATGTVAVGATDGVGDAHAFTVTFQMTPPGGAWSVADNGTYTVRLGGLPITDLAGNVVPTGTLGTFLVQLTTDHLVVATQPPPSVTAGSGFGLTIDIDNSAGQLDTSFNGAVTVALATNPGSTTLGGTLTVNATNGVAAFSALTLNIAANGYSLNVGGGGLVGLTTNSFNVTAAAASQLFVTSQPPATVTAGNGFGLAVTAEDRFGNIATTFNSLVTVALSSNPGGATLGGTVSATPVNGVATFSGLTVTAAANGYTLKANGGGLPQVVSSAFNVNAAAASKLVVTSQPPASVTAGNGFGLVVSAEDRFGNIATSYTTSVTVALTTNPGSTTLGGTLTATPSGGVATFAGLTINTAAIGYVLSASSGTITTAISNAFNVIAAAPSQLVVSSQPPVSVTAGTGFGLAVTAEDRFGNIVTTYAGPVSVALASNPRNATLGGVVNATPNNGVAIFSGLTITAAANGYTIRASSGGLATATTNAFNVVAAAATHLIVTAQPPSSVTAGNGFGFAASALDPFGNVDTSFGHAVTVALASNPTGTTLAGTLTVTPQNGVATFSGLTINLAANGYSLSATASGVTAATTGGFSVTAAAASQLVMAAEPPASVTAGTAFGFAVVAEDRFGNVASTYSLNVFASLSSNPGGATLGGTLTATPVNGVASFAGLTINFAANGYRLQAASGTLTSATTNLLNVTPAAASQLVVSAQPPGSVIAGSGFGLAVSAEDRFGNLVTSFGGSVTLALGSHPNGSTLGGTLTVSATNGVSTFSGLSITTAATGYNIRAGATGLSSATTNNFSVVSAAVSQLAVSAQPPATVTAGNSFGFAVTAKDRYGNVVTSFTGPVTVAIANNPGRTTLNGTLTVDAVNGVATYSGLSINIAAVGYTLSASSSGLTSATTAGLNVTSAAATQLVMTTQPPATVVHNVGFGLAVSVEDQFGNVVTSFSGTARVTILLNPGGSTLRGTLNVSFVNGVATFSGLRLNRPGNAYALHVATIGLAPVNTIRFNVV
jgi:hypothetical protein